MATLSVIVPTHKRAAILQRCVDHLKGQTIAKDLEVILVSDGEDAATEELFGDLQAKDLPFPISCTTIPKAQQGTARNRGVALAQSPLCLLLGDDMIPPTRRVRSACPRACARRARTRRTGLLHVGSRCRHHPRHGMVGGIRLAVWVPRIERYAHTVLPSAQQHLYTYTGNISIPTDIARRIPFREDVALYGWEDIEWGMRLKGAGVALFYEPDAKALHHHHLDLEDSLKRMETIGASAVAMHMTVPNFDRLPTGWKLFAYRCAALLPSMAGRHRRAFLHGITQATKS